MNGTAPQAEWSDILGSVLVALGVAGVAALLFILLATLLDRSVKPWNRDEQ